MNDPKQQAKLTDRHEHNGWPKTPQQQVELEHQRAHQFPVGDVPTFEPSCVEPLHDAEWRKEFDTLLRTHRRDAMKVKESWEKRLHKQEIPLPTHLGNTLDYVVECRRRVRANREQHRRSLAHARELLEEFVSDFDRIRAILDRNQTGCETFAKIERLHEALMSEIAKAPGHTTGGSNQ